MRALGKVLDRLAVTTANFIDNEGTDSFFIMRCSGTGTPDGRGGLSKDYTETTETPISCLTSIIEARGQHLTQIAATRRVPVIFHKIVCAASVDCTTSDRVTILARGSQPVATAIEVISSKSLNGVAREIIAVEEQKGAVH